MSDEKNITKEAFDIYTKESIEEVLLALEVIFVETSGKRFNFSDDALRSALMTFVKISSEKMYELQDSENMAFDDSVNMVESFGKELRKLIKTYTNIDTFELYKK